MRSTPTAVLEILLMLPLLNIFIEKEARQVMYRLKCLGRLKNSRTGHSLIYDKMFKESPIIAAKTDIKTTHTNVFDRRFFCGDSSQGTLNEPSGKYYFE
jgi:hypothetical protein